MRLLRYARNDGILEFPNTEITQSSWVMSYQPFIAWAEWASLSVNVFVLSAILFSVLFVFSLCLLNLFRAFVKLLILA